MSWRTNRLFLLLIAVEISTFASRPLAADEPQPRQWALLVGVDDYNDLEDLHCAGNDQRAFARQLVACGFPQDQVFLLDDKAQEKKYLPTTSSDS